MTVTTKFSIQIHKADSSRIHELDLDTLQFGKQTTDHLFLADYRNGEWTNARIIPFENLHLPPGVSGLHYGQSLFEGMKAFPHPSGKIGLFRLNDHWVRMNKGARRLAMPEIPEELFKDSIRTLLDLDRNWMPRKEGYAMYIRPLLFATDPYIGMKPSETYTFMVFLAPAPPYYAKNVHAKVVTEYVRACPLGTGSIKAAGNYAPTLLITQQLKKEGYDVGLWLDAVERKYIEEFSTMNAFIVIKDKVLTPPAPDGGTILNGITRRSVIHLLKEAGYDVEERRINIDEIQEAYENGELNEMFGTGTAAAIAPVEKINYQSKDISAKPSSEWKIIPFLKEKLEGIRYGNLEDKYNWLELI